jgi:hypothetical protein
MELENQVVRRPEKLTVLLVRVASGVEGQKSKNSFAAADVCGRILTTPSTRKDREDIDRENKLGLDPSPAFCI